MPTARTPRAPALERGLAMLEHLAGARDGLTFGELMAAVDAPHATAARLLAFLRHAGYVARDEHDGRYRLGERMASLRGPRPPLERLRELAPSAVRELCDRTANTAMVIGWSALRVVCVAKAMDPASIPMQEVGTVNENVDRTPWGWLFYHEASSADRRRIVGSVGNARRFKREATAGVAFYRRHGYLYDDRQHYRHVRRIAAPIRDGPGAAVGAVCVGGNTLTLSDDDIEPCARLVRAAAERLSRACGWTGVARPGGPQAGPVR